MAGSMTVSGADVGITLPSCSMISDMACSTAGTGEVKGFYRGGKKSGKTSANAPGKVHIAQRTLEAGEHRQIGEVALVDGLAQRHHVGQRHARLCLLYSARTKQIV